MSLENAIKYINDHPEHWLSRDIRNSVLNKKRIPEWATFELEKRGYSMSIIESSETKLEKIETKPETSEMITTETKSIEQQKKDFYDDKCCMCSKNAEVISGKDSYCFKCSFESLDLYCRLI